MKLAEGLIANQARASANQSDEPRSTITERPTMDWPHLGDEDVDVDDFFERFEETIGLANDGRGMNARERLRVLRSCLKQSRAKVYDVVLTRDKLEGRLRPHQRSLAGVPGDPDRGADAGGPQLRAVL